MKSDNPKAFKNWINQNTLQRLADSINSVHRPFDSSQLTSLGPLLLPLELKDRVRLIRDRLHELLPKDFPVALAILANSQKNGQLEGFELWPYTEYIQTFGLKHSKISLQALRELTQFFTAEFTVRPFITNNQKETLAFLKKCAVDKNVHVRRLASEGARPRLPWGERLPSLIKDPKLTTPILELLKNDPQLYVRKSVANHLNDVSKDHPQVVFAVLRRWLDRTSTADRPKIQWIAHRALRTLIKNGNPQALKILGVDTSIKIRVHGLRINQKRFKINDTLEFSFKIFSLSKKPQKLIVDYIVHHVKAGGKTTPKVFKLKTLSLDPRHSVEVLKKHSLRPVTTRRYYAGAHRIEIQVNGKVYSEATWLLEI